MDNLARLREVLPSLKEHAGQALIDKNTEYASPCPECGGTDRFFWKKGEQKGHCRACNKTIDTIDIATTQTGKDIPALLEEYNISVQKPAKGTPPGPTSCAAWELAIADHDNIHKYFKSRKISFSESFPLPPAINYSEFPDKDTGETLRSILCAVTSPADTAVKATSRIWLDGDINKDSATMKGKCKGRGVWFHRKRVGEPSLIIGEGVETTLSAMQATGINGVAGLDAGKMQAVELPDTVKDVFILVDQDKNTVGQEASMALAEKLKIVGKTAWLVAPTDECFSDDPPKKLDFNDLDREQISARFEKKQKLVDIDWRPGKGQPDTPLPLVKKNEGSAPFPFDALGGTMQAACEKLSESIQAPDAIIAQSVLGAANLAVQGLSDIMIDGRVFPVSLFLLSIAGTGERKSAVDRVALAAHREIERDNISKLADKQGLYKINKAAYDSEEAAAIKDKKKSLEEKQASLAALQGQKPTPPLDQIMLVTDFTYEALFKLFKIGIPCKGLFADEGGQVTGGHGMKTESILATATGLSKFWDGDRVDRIRVIDGNSHLYGRRLAVHLMMQDGVGLDFYTNGVLTDQGLISRFLAVMPTSRVGGRPYTRINASESGEMLSFYTKVREALQKPLPLKDGEEQELELPRMTLSPEAKKRWIELYNQIEHESGPKQMLAPIRGFANKSAEHAARLAGTIQLLDDPESVEIKAESMSRGIVAIEWYLDEALRIAGCFVPERILSQAKEVLRWIHESYMEIETLIPLPDVYQYSPVRSASTARKIMKMLVSHNHLIPPAEDEDQSVNCRNGGLSSEWWRLHPKSRDYFNFED